MSKFVPYELALLAKEKGFDEKFVLGNVTALYDKHGNFTSYTNYGVYYSGLSKEYILAPLYQQLVDWFREKHNTVINVYANASGYLFEFHDSANKGGTHRYDSGFSGDNESGCWDNYYDAFNEALQEAFKLI